MNYESLLIRCQKKYPKEDCLESIILNFQDVFSDGEFGDNSRMCDLFYITDKMGKAQFFRIKKYVKEFYIWLYEQGVVSESLVSEATKITMDDVISSREIQKTYFRDLDSALDFVEAVGSSCGLNEYDDLLVIKTIVILSWCGLERTEISEIKKCDLIYPENSIRFDGKAPIVLKTEYFDILHRFSELDMHRGFPSGKIQVYESSPYLMRAARSTRMDSDKISQAIKRFNVIAFDRFGHRLSVKALQNNGTFCKVLKALERDSRTLTEVVMSVACCDRHVAFWYKTMFEKWRSIYYPENERSVSSKCL